MGHIAVKKQCATRLGTISGLWLLLIVILAIAGTVHGQNLQEPGRIGYKCFIKEEGSYPAYGSTVNVVDMWGDTLATSYFWKGIIENVQPGLYQLSAINGPSIFVDTVKVTPGKETLHSFLFDIETGGIEFAHFLRGARDSPAFGTVTRIRHERGEIVYSGNQYAGQVSDLPVGTYVVEASHSGIVQTGNIDVEIDKLNEINFDFPLPVGKISYECFLDSALGRPAYGTRLRIMRVSSNEIVLVDTSRYRGQTRNLPIGEYAITGSLLGKTVTINIELETGITEHALVILNIEQVRMNYECYRNARNDPANGTQVTIYDLGGVAIESATGWRGSFILPTGPYDLIAQYQGLEVTKRIVVQPTVSNLPQFEAVHFSE